MIRARVRPAENRTVVKTRGNVWKIVETIVQADRESAEFTEELARDLRQPSDLKSLQEAWKFVKTHVRYVRDRAGRETIKSPGKTWADQKGDCKSFSVFVGSLLQNWGIPYVYRVAFYDPKNPQSGHIYPVALLDGKEIPVDAVHTRFGEEAPYWKAYDVKPGTGERTRLSGSAGAGKGWIIAAVLAAILIAR
ncbi:MAG: hypothetical protein KF852_04225 [Saprospiraceae bacterium]|nr:hypothetical protein [Saprospiraceae bacterium]